MNVLIYARRFWPSVGGMESSIACLATYLSRCGEDVCVVTENAYSGENPFPFPVYWKPDRAALRGLVDECDVLHLNVMCLGLRLRALLLGKKVAITYADVTPICPKGSKLRWNGPCDGAGPLICLKCMKRSGTPNRFKYLVRPLVKSLTSLLSHANIVTSPWAMQKYPLVRKRQVPRFIDADHFAPRDSQESEMRNDRQRLRVVYSGRLAEEKGVHVLIDALRICVESGCPFDLDVVGDGDQWDPLHEQVRADGLGDYVTWRGRLEGEALVAAMRDADVAVVPSVWIETFGRAAAEAMAVGLPVIVTDAGGIEDVVGEVGIVVRRGDPDELARAIAKLARDEGLRRRLGRAGRQRVIDEFGELPALRRHLELYAEITGRSIAGSSPDPELP